MTKSSDHHNQPETATRTHVPELEQWAYNQRPKTREHRDIKLYRYAGTDLYQWFSKRGDSVFEEPCNEPFVIRPKADQIIAMQSQGREPVAWTKPGALEAMKKCGIR